MQLIKYDAACRAVAIAKTVDEVKDIRDKSMAIQAYGRQAKNRDIEADGFEIRMRAERRLGQILKETPMNKGEAGRFTGGTAKEPPVAAPTLSDMGIDKKLSSSSQKIAVLEEDDFEKRVAVGREKIKDAVKSAHVSNNSGENEWYTPVNIIESARKVMKGISLDPASSEVANKNIKAPLYFTKKISGLEQKWSGNVWLNPPYAQPLISQFSEKLISEIPNFDQAIMLVNNATETSWGQPLLEKCQAVCFIKGRVKFINKSGDLGGAPLQGQMILYFGNRPQTFVNEFTKYGHVLTNGI